MKYCRLNTNIQKNIIECYVQDYSVRKAAETLCLHKNTVHLYYKKLRELILHHSKHYFYNKKIRNTPPPNLYDKKLIVGIGKVNETMSVVQISKPGYLKNEQEVSPEFVIYTNKQAHEKTKIVELKMLKLQTPENNLNHIESITFWTYIKEKINNHNFIADQQLYALLKEHEWRYNNNKGQQYLYLEKWANIPINVNLAHKSLIETA